MNDALKKFVESYQPDKDALRFNVDVVKLINKYRPSLELPVLFCLNSKYSSIINGYGRGLAIIGDKAIGKGEIIKITFCLLDTCVSFDVDKFTLAFMTRFVKENKMELLDYELIIEDLSTTVDSGYPETFFNMASKFVWDKKAGTGTADIYDKDLNLNIKKAKDVTVEVKSFNAVIGMTNEIHRKIKAYQAYLSMWKDRFTEFYPIVTRMEKERIDNEFNFNPDNPNKCSATDLRDRIKDMLPTKTPPRKTLPLAKNISPELYKETYRALYRYQHTDNRGTTYFKGDLSANALLNGRKEITKDDLAFYLLYRPNLVLSEFSPTIQRIVQNVSYCNDIWELSHILGKSEYNIKMAIQQNPNANELVTYEGEIVSHNEKFAKLLLAQQKFIGWCLK